jgi:hypothetical protein
MAVSMILDHSEDRTAAESAERRHVMREVPRDDLDPRIEAPGWRLHASLPG